MENEELQRLVEEISFEDFGKPFLHKAVFNPRLRSTGGRYLLRSHHIEINKKYFDQFGETELVGIIKHELCHYHLHLEGKGYQHRDRDFRELMKQVNAPRFCSTLPEQQRSRATRKTLEYKCMECGLLYQRKRVIDTKRFVCGKCRGKLKFIKELTNK